MIGNVAAQKAYLGTLCVVVAYWCFIFCKAIPGAANHPKEFLRSTMGVLHVLGTGLSHRLCCQLLDGREFGMVGHVVLGDDSRRRDIINNLRWRFYLLGCPFAVLIGLNIGKAVATETLSTLPEDYFPHWLTFASQWGSLVVLDLSCVLSKHLVDVFCIELEREDESSASIDVRMARKSMIGPGVWVSFYRSHMALDDLMDHLWKKAGVPVVALLLPWLWDAFYCLVRIAAEDTTWKRLYYTACTGVIMVCMLLLLSGAASVTEACMSLRSGKRSIRSIASRLGRYDMPMNVRIEHTQFMQHVDRTPIGIEVPVIGLIDRTFIRSKVNLLLKFIPVCLTLGLRLYGR